MDNNIIYISQFDICIHYSVLTSTSLVPSMTIYLTLFIHFATLLTPYPSGNHQCVVWIYCIYAFCCCLFGTEGFCVFFFFAHSELHVNLCSLWFSAILELPPSFPNTKAQVACRVLAYLSWLYLNQINPFGNILEAMFSLPHYSHIYTSASTAALPVPLLSQSISLSIKFTAAQLGNLVLAPLLLLDSSKSSQLKKTNWKPGKSHHRSEKWLKDFTLPQWERS